MYHSSRRLSSRKSYNIASQEQLQKADEAWENIILTTRDDIGTLNKELEYNFKKYYIEPNFENKEKLFTSLVYTTKDSIIWNIVKHLYLSEEFEEYLYHITTYGRTFHNSI